MFLGGYEIVLEIILIVIGIAVIFISYKSLGNFDESESEVSSHEINYDFGFENLERQLTDRAKEILDKTEYKLDQMSNEKIMSLDDFSKEILEKIKNNHEEVVFLYNLSNEKEDTLKRLLEEINLAQKGSIVNEKNIPAENKKDQVKKEVETKDVNYDKILALHDAGHSILEISQELDIGQGEAKLIVDLHGR